MAEDNNFSFEEKSTRKAVVFGIITAIAGLILYNFTEVIHNSRIRDEEMFFSLIYGFFCFCVGFITGLVIYKSKNTTAYFLPCVMFIVHYFLFSDNEGDEISTVLLQCFYSFLSLLIVFAVIIIAGYLHIWVDSGKEDK